jgi:hypothetical protein
MMKVGRPKAEYPTKQTAIRIDADLLAILKNEAGKNGVSISKEILQRLWGSFGTTREVAREAARYEKAWTSQEFAPITCEITKPAVASIIADCGIAGHE